MNRLTSLELKLEMANSSVLLTSMEYFLLSDKGRASLLLYLIKVGSFYAAAGHGGAQQRAAGFVIG